MFLMVFSTLIRLCVWGGGGALLTPTLMSLTNSSRFGCGYWCECHFIRCCWRSLAADKELQLSDTHSLPTLHRWLLPTALRYMCHLHTRTVTLHKLTRSYIQIRRVSISKASLDRSHATRNSDVWWHPRARAPRSVRTLSRWEGICDCDVMVAARCNGWRVMTPSVFRLVFYKPCFHREILAATGRHSFFSQGQ